jgi:TolB-like protein/two-component SAPR family response regulator
MARTLKLRLLGPFSARWSDGESVGLTARKARALLAFLAVEPRGASRERVAALLWGDLSDQRARHNLRQTLSAIRSACGPVVATRGDRLELDTECCTADVIDFQRLAGATDREALSRCLALYAGDLLEDVSPREEDFESWLRGARERLRGRACDAMDRLVEQLVAGERFDDAVEALNRRLAMDPACEPAHRRLMEVYARTGRRTEALRQYEACVRALDRELGVEPDAGTEELADAIRCSDAAPAPARARPAVETPAQNGETPRVAVLPFEKVSPDTDDYFANGITEDIITALSRFHSLHVIARGSTFVYKGQDVPDREVAEALGARFLVRGSVQKVGERVRINVQLLDGPEGLNLWAHRFDRDMADVFVVQDEITSTIVATLAGRVESVEIARARKAPPKRLDAYDYLLRGKDLHHRFNPHDCAACIEMFARAIDRDGGYAVAHAWLACGLGQAMVFDLDDKAKLVDQAQAAAERGLELDENESECHRILAQVHLTRGNLARAIRHQERALFLNPNDDRSVCAMGELLAFAGRPEEAEQWVRKSMSLNPYHPQRYWTHLARALFHQGRYAETGDALDQIGRPRSDDLAYAVAASAMLQDGQATARNVEALRVAFPDFSAAEFVDNLPYARDEDLDLLRDALVRTEF